MRTIPTISLQCAHLTDHRDKSAVEEGDEMFKIQRERDGRIIGQKTFLVV